MKKKKNRLQLYKIRRGSEYFMKEIPENINNIINEFITGVNNILGDRVEKIILYGSYARRRL